MRLFNGKQVGVDDFSWEEIENLRKYPNDFIDYVSNVHIALTIPCYRAEKSVHEMSIPCVARAGKWTSITHPYHWDWRIYNYRVVKLSPTEQFYRPYSEINIDWVGKTVISKNKPKYGYLILSVEGDEVVIANFGTVSLYSFFDNFMWSDGTVCGEILP